LYREKSPVLHPDGRPSVINCLNGELWLTDEGPELRPHDPESLLPWKPNISWIETWGEGEKVAPIYSKFIRNLFAIEDSDEREKVINCLEEVISIGLFRPKADHLAMLWFLGQGANGKTSLMNIIVSVVGEDLCPTMNVNQLREGSNETRFLPTARFALDDDVSMSGTFDDGMLKKLSGPTRLSIKKLYENLYIALVDLLLIMGMNHTPEIRDMSHGLWRRVFPFFFEKTFRKDVSEGHPCSARQDWLENIMSNERERSGIMARWVSAHYRLRERGYFDIPETVKKWRERIRHDADTMLTFINHCLEPDVNSEIKFTELIDGYGNWLDSEGLPDQRYSRSNKGLTKHLEELGFKTVRRQNAMYLIGYRFREGAKQELFQSTIF